MAVADILFIHSVNEGGVLLDEAQKGTRCSLGGVEEGEEGALCRYRLVGGVHHLGPVGGYTVIVR